MPIVGRGLWLREELSPGLKLDALDGNVVERELEIVNGAHDSGVQAVVLTSAKWSTAPRHGHHQAEWRLRMSSRPPKSDGASSSS